MSNIPEGLKSKYNKDNKFIWVDSQWEKFMDKQREIENQLSHALQELDSIYFMVDTTPNDMELGKRVRKYYWDNTEETKTTYMYESPDGGNTIYRRKSGQDERVLVKDRNQLELFGD